MEIAEYTFTTREVDAVYASIQGCAATASMICPTPKSNEETKIRVNDSLQGRHCSPTPSSAGSAFDHRMGRHFAWICDRARSSALFFDPHKFAACGIHGNPQLGFIVQTAT